MKAPCSKCKVFKKVRTYKGVHLCDECRPPRQYKPKPYIPISLVKERISEEPSYEIIPQPEIQFLS